MFRVTHVPRLYVYTCARAAVQSKVDAARNATLAAAATLVCRRYTNFNFPKVAYSWSQRARRRSSVFVIMFYGCHMSWPSFAASLVSRAIPRRSRRSRIRPANNFLILRHSSDMRRTNIRMTALLCVICPNGNAALECANITRAESSTSAIKRWGERCDRNANKRNFVKKKQAEESARRISHTVYDFSALMGHCAS